MTEDTMTDHNTENEPTTAVFLDASIPNTARIFDYLLGGSANFEVDRQAAEEMLKILPSLRKWVRLRRAFIQEAAQILHAEGFAQFLDLGSGMPSEDHIHAFVPGAHVIYSDINPVAVSYGDSLFTDLDQVTYIRGDARQIETILQAPEVYRLLNRQEKIAIGLNALLLFLSTAENQRLAQALFEWAPPGSKIFLVLQTRGNLEKSSGYEEFTALTRAAHLPTHLYHFDECVNMLHPWQPDFVEPITRFLGLPDDYITEADRGDVDMAFYAAFFMKSDPVS